MSNNAPSQDTPRAPAEWTTLGVACVILAGLIGLVIYAWQTTPAGAAQLQVRQTEAAIQEGSAWRVPFEATNSGGKAATQIQLVAALQVGDEPPVETTQTLDVLAPGQREAGAFFFPVDPATGELTLRVAAYLEP